MGVALGRVLKTAGVNFWRNGWVSLATILVMVLAIFMVGSVLLFQVLLTSTLDQVEKKVDVSVYFKTDADESEALRIKDLVAKLPEVKTVDFISREDALRTFKDKHSGNALIASALDELGENPLGASLKIRATSPSEYEAIARFLEDGSFSTIDKINYRQNKIVFDRLAMILATSRKVGGGISIVLGVIAFLVAFNTIRLAIYTARDEISIMRIVGASNWFVRAPFLIEGILYGVCAGVATMLIFWPLTLWLGPRAQVFLGGINIYNYYISNFFQFFFILFFVGVAIGVISSFVATRRYLRI